MRPHRAAALLLTMFPLAALLAGCESAATVSRSVRFGERPRWTAGDSWTYRGKGRDGAYTITRTVLREGLFEGHEAYEVQAGDSRYWYTKQLGYLAKVTGDQTVRRAIPAEDWRWPLQVGKSWSTTVTWVDGADRDEGVVLTAIWEVEDYEDVKTPAGTFKAFKVSRREIESGASQVYWYSPAVKSWVKLRGSSAAEGDYEEELTDYSPR
ncbi:MAG: hypothetical protein ACREI4_09635 [Candidatus Rokuibacteriota bacterium]